MILRGIPRPLLTPPPPKKMLLRLQILVAQVQAVEINRVKIKELIVLNTTCTSKELLQLTDLRHIKTMVACFI